MTEMIIVIINMVFLNDYGNKYDQKTLQNMTLKSKYTKTGMPHPL